MRLALCVVVVLFGFPLGKMFVLHPSPEASSANANRCRGELEIRKILLESLNLQQEPHVYVSKMNRLRDKWKGAFKSRLPSSPGNSTFPEDSGNSTCCKRSCQVFIKESFTFVQCRSCGVKSADAATQRCKPTAHGILPFVYVDEWSSLVLSSVSLIHECGCDPGEKTQDPEVTTPS
ncbi:Formate-dependent phosphoribosylglycinamide formyltransferase [Labeo rohita]|uniref:Formate-dependent phosphoribosylglycinamide formyltransferase n=1 Tax=Labeo rohita TaxID=84645 RepID=A0ABQ8L186_LABRO|nr:Formate-dependent phosphoribosylglycinamide formyltransferase [Labeo rohita]